MARGNRKEKFYDDSISPEVKDEIEKAITEYSPAEVEKTGPETKNGIVTNCVHVRIRKTPTSNGDVVAILGKETRVQILGEENGFYKVSTIGLSKPGYIMSKYIKEE